MSAANTSGSCQPIVVLLVAFLEAEFAHLKEQLTKAWSSPSQAAFFSQGSGLKLLSTSESHCWFLLQSGKLVLPVCGMLSEAGQDYLLSPH